VSLGPILFLQPLALLGLLALPILWFLLRATPPEPRRLALPSLALMDDLQSEEETPSRTPWWLLLLRMLALALAIVGFARPTWQPNPQADTTGGMLIVVDDGWTSGERWRDIVRSATSAVDEASQAGQAVHLLFTAPRDIQGDPNVALDAETARQQLRNARPQPWAPDRADALKRLQATSLNPGRIVWFSDGFDYDSAGAFARGLAAEAVNTEVRVNRPRSAYAITSGISSAEGARVTVVRPIKGPATTADLIAETSEGASVASTRLAFADQATTAEALFAIPAAALNRVARFRIAGSTSAGAVWLWDDAARRATVGLADTQNERTPLLSEHYYVRKALQPYAQLVDKPLDELLAGSVDAIIMADRGAIDDDTEAKLDAWINNGGVLIRFAGPRLAASNDALVPTPLRPSSRALGGALAWENPQKIAPFANTSPFFGIPAPTDAVVRQQVLAQPASDLNEKTWARLEDGTPLVTASRRGSGELILFHITADPDWSDLPYTGAFVEMLRRSVVSGGERVQSQLNQQGELAAVRTLDGFGILGAPPGTAAPIPAADFPTTRPGPTTPPGLYAGPGGERALNVGAPAPTAMLDWPGEVKVVEQAAVLERRGLGGWMIAVALGIVALDILIALHFAGRLPHFGRRKLTAAAALFAVGLVFGHAPDASAQQSREQMIAEATSNLRFAYVVTPDRRLNEITRAGLMGLGHILEERTAVEPGEPHGVNLERDELSLYPMIYYAVPRDARPFSPAAVARLNNYLRAGGALVVDTRDAAPGRDISADLGTLLQGIDAPPLQPAPANHVLTKSYYLISNFPGRLNGRLWIESGTGDRDTRRGDGVSRLFIGGSDWAGAWAAQVRGDEVVPMFSVQGGERQREMAYRFGVNLVMYILTGNYKEDQVHVHDILERLGRESRGEPEPPAGAPSPGAPR
jgi:hypothetical protein